MADRTPMEEQMETGLTAAAHRMNNPPADWPASDMLEAAWGLIANAWTLMEDTRGETSQVWLTAAAKWRDAYHKGLPELGRMERLEQASTENLKLMQGAGAAISDLQRYVDYLAERIQVCHLYHDGSEVKKREGFQGESGLPPGVLDMGGSMPRTPEFHPDDRSTDG